MSPRIIKEGHCPHCGAELPKEVPRTCPECAGSLQKRYLSSGCLTSKPLLVFLAALGWAIASDRGSVSAALDPGTGESTATGRCIDAFGAIHRGASPVEARASATFPRSTLEAHLGDLPAGCQAADPLRRPSRSGTQEEGRTEEGGEEERDPRR